jgi:cytochrome b
MSSTRTGHQPLGLALTVPFFTTVIFMSISSVTAGQRVVGRRNLQRSMRAARPRYRVVPASMSSTRTGHQPLGLALIVPFFTTVIFMSIPSVTAGHVFVSRGNLRRNMRAARRRYRVVPASMSSTRTGHQPLGLALTVPFLTTVIFMLVSLS